MSSFRIMDTKFRILKGGKIGLAMSIAMIGGMLTLGSTSANATTYSASNVGFYTGSSSTTINTDAGGQPAINVAWSTADSRTGTLTINSGDSSGIYVTGSANGDSVNGYPILSSTSGNGQLAGWSSARDYITTTLTTRNYVDAFDTVINLTNGNTIGSGGIAINVQDDTGGSSVLNLDSVNRTINGSIYVDDVNLLGFTTTFNGSVYSNIDMSASTAAVFTNAATSIGAINGAGAFVYLNGNNSLTGIVTAATVSLSGNDITFNDNVTATTVNFTAAGDATMASGADLTGNVNFNGQDATFILSNGSNVTGNIDTAVSRTGTLIFEGSSTVSGNIGATSAIKEIKVNSTGVDIINGSTRSNYVNLNAAGTIAFGGGLDTRLADGALSTVDFNNYDGTVQIGDNGSLYGNVITDTNNNGTLTMISGTQVITGQIGTSADKIKTLNIGGTGIGGGLDTNASVYSVTTANGDIYAQSTVLNNNSTTNGSELSMASGYDLYSTVTTADADVGTLKLLGGNQIVTGNVGLTGTRLAQVDSGANGAVSNFGTSDAQTDVFAVTVQNTGTGTTNFSHDVGATTINVANGISNFTNNVDATITNIGTGVANFNTNGTGATNTNIVFTADKTNSTTSDKTGNISGLGSATANLMNSLTGNIDFAGKDAVVNVWHEPITWEDPFLYNSYLPASITGNITTILNNTGIINFRGAGIIDGTVGSTNMGISQLNINTNNEQSGYSGYEWKEVVATGDIYAGSVNLKNDGTLILEDGVDITGTNSVVALSGTQQVISTDVDGTGRLNFNGSSVVTGVVGANNLSIGTIDTIGDIDNSTVEFKNMVYVDTLWALDNTIILNGQAGLQVDGTAGTSVNSSVAGLKGTINFDGNGAGTIQIGDGVNLTTGTSGIQFVDANLATLTFNGSSTVTGVLGGNTDGRSTFAKIYAGANTKTVTFTDDVHVMEGGSTPATFYVSGTGTVNFQGNLYGDLVYNDDGVVNVSNGKSIFVNTVPVAVTTITDGTGTLNYLGSTTLDTDIGTTDAMLKSVTFNSASNNVVQNIGHNVYADTVTIGGTSGTTAISLVDLTGVYDYAGATTMKEYRGGTVANITAAVILGGDLVIANDTSAINFGKSHVTVGMNHDGITPGAFTTNNGAMSFTVDTRDITGANQADSTSIGSGQVTTDSLNMSGNEKIHINYVGSLANNGTYTLVSDTGTTSTGTYSGTELNGKVSDNSFVIDTKIDKTAVGSDLILRADRTAGGSYSADELYVEKSGTRGLFSNNAAIALAAISADGGQTGDMIEVIQKLELDSFGYGNTQENLAVQVQKLAPIVNTSFAQTSIGATKLVTDTVGSRLSDVRGLSSGEEVKDKGVWAKVTGSVASQDKVGQYDGYSLSSGGVVFGIDKELKNNTIIGLAAGYTNTKTEQDDFRDGDKSTTNSYQLSVYASKTFDKAYVDGSLSYTKHNTDGERTTAIDRVASYDVDADQLSAKINGGYNFILENKVVLTPFASLEYSTIKQNAYKETGAGAINLSVDDVTVNRGAAGLGVKISKEIKTEKNTYIPEFKLGANKYFGDDNVEVEAQFEQGNKFITRGADMTDVMYNAGLGLKTKFTEDTSVSLSTDYERSNDGDFQGVNGQLTFRMQF